MMEEGSWDNPLGHDSGLVSMCLHFRFLLLVTSADLIFVGPNDETMCVFYSTWRKMSLLMPSRP